jgi:adenosylcobinamide-phosphate synthase
LITADHVWLLALAMVVDAIVGDPNWAWSRVPHPVALIGGLIATLDHRLNRPHKPRLRQRMAGAIAVAIVVALSAAIGHAIETLFAAIPYGWIGTVIAAAVLLAGRSLYDHVVAVAHALRAGSLGSARHAVARIVGRDTETLDEGGIARAAIETLAENLSDGLIAPALWFLLLGLPGMLAYKAISTADSMIGHLTPAYADFGWVAARLDDLMNLPASRISAVLIALAAPVGAGRTANALRVTLADASRHASPNAGWPEAAMAGALGVAIGGPKTYSGELVAGAWLNPGGRPATPADVHRALGVYLGAAAIAFAGVSAAAFVVLAA